MQFDCARYPSVTPDAVADFLMTTSSANIKFTNPALMALPAPQSGRVEYLDTEESGLRLRVSASGAKSFTVLRRVAGKLQRVTLGIFTRPGDKVPRMTVEMARKAKRKADGAIASGGDPNAEKKAQRERGRTLAEVLADYLRRNSKLKERTRSDYQKVLAEFCKDWLDKPMAEITREQIKKRHASHGKERSEARANNAVRVLRALFYFAGVAPNPAANPKKKGPGGAFLFDDKRKRTRIAPKEMPAWWGAVSSMQGRRSDSGARDAGDLLRFLLLTGLRAGEACGLRWDGVNVSDGIITIADTKNHEDHVLPLGSLLREIIERRYRTRGGSEYVFASKGDAKAPFSYNTLRGWFESTAAECGVRITAHDCRRTFASIAESLEISAYAVKRLLNHRSGNADVTAGYIVIDPERLRGAMQRIEDEVLRLASAEVAP